MWPLYKKDVIDEKNITREEALEMLECLYLKTCEVYEVRDDWYATAFAGYPMWQTLVVGGQTRDGKDATNDLSYLCLAAGKAACDGSESVGEDSRGSDKVWLQDDTGRAGESGLFQR